MTNWPGNLGQLEPLLAKLRADGIGHSIAGQRVDGKATFDTISPVDKSQIAKVARGTAADIDRAAAAANTAFKSWAAWDPAKRRALLHRIADTIEAHAGDIALLESWDTGQPYRFMSKAAVRSAENFRFFADRVPDARNGLNLPTADHWNVTTRVPIGPVGIITPWNAPLMLSTWRIAPALACGNTVILKPAEWSPLTAWKLAEVFAEAGLPPGVFNVVQGFGEEAGAPLVAHPDVPLICLTGETTTGSTVIKTGADQLKRMSLELGGKSPAIVFADADLDRALDAVVFQIYSFNGERCTANSRLLVEAARYSPRALPSAHGA